MVALVIGGVMGLVLLSYLSLTSNQNVMTARSEAWNAAMPLVEAGVEEAIAHLTASPSNWVANGWEGKTAAVAGVQWQVHLDRNLGDGFYSVTITNRDNPVIISTGNIPAPLTTNHLSRTVRVELVMKPQIGPGLGAKGVIDMNGNKLFVDSYDSSDPNNSDAFGMYDKNKHDDDVTVATNGGFIDAINLGNAEVWGKVATAPGGTIDILKNGIVGSSDWHSKGGSKGIEAGYSSSDADIPFPNTQAPASGSSPPVDLLGNVVLGSGVYEVGSLTGPLVVTGDATLIVRTTFSISGTDAIHINPGASLKLYVYAATASFGAGSYNFLAGNRATNLKYFGMPSNTAISFNGNTSFQGVVYAPDAELSCNGGGTGLNLCGASMTKTVKMNGSFNFHYDEALRDEGEPGYVIARWDEL